MMYNDLIDMVKAVIDYEMPEGSRLKERMDEVMGGEVLELYSERVLRLEREKVQNLSVDRLVEKLKMTEQEACELIGVDFENYKAYKESQKETKQEKEEDLPRRRSRRG